MPETRVPLVIRDRGIQEPLLSSTCSQTKKPPMQPSPSSPPPSWISGQTTPASWPVPGLPSVTPSLQPSLPVNDSSPKDCHRLIRAHRAHSDARRRSTHVRPESLLQVV